MAWATVRCDGAPRTTTDLRIDAQCPVVLLLGALQPGSVDDAPWRSLAHVQLRVGFPPLALLAAAGIFGRGRRRDD